MKGVMGRPKAEKPKGVTISLRLDTEVAAKLEAYCKSRRLSKSEVLRRAILSLKPC